MSEQELLYTMALTMALRQQPKPQRTLLQELGSATAIYENRRDLGRMFERFSEHASEELARMDQLLSRCEHEVEYADRHHIRILHIQDEENYPTRLAQCEDAPLLLYTLGTTDLNVQRIISIVGTRRCSERGRDLCHALVRGIAEQCSDALIVSGLAYGIDVASHRAALECGLPTIGVLAHGLDEIYPRTHRPTAIEMLKRGGLVTEFMSHTPIDKVNFLQRNRIVAGLADAVVIVESPARGGSLNTARLAGDYHREVFAFPGRPTDTTSEGCNLLIRRNGATLITSPSDLLTDMGWKKMEPHENEKPAPQQTTLFPELSSEEQAVVDVLSQADSDISMSELAHTLALPIHRVTPLMLSLELKGVIKVLPGGRCHVFGQ